VGIVVVDSAAEAGDFVNETRRCRFYELLDNSVDHRDKAYRNIGVRKQRRSRPVSSARGAECLSCGDWGWKCRDLTIYLA
jgi:hypothetical protein